MLFSAPAGPNPLESLETRCSGVHKNDQDRKFSSRPAERERRSTPGTASPARIEGSQARRNRRVEPDGIRPSSPVAHRMADRVADRRRRAGKRAGKRESSRRFLRLLLFEGASAGRGRRTSGVDGVDMGHRTRHIKEYYLEKGNIFVSPARPSPPPPCPSPSSEGEVAERSEVEGGVPAPPRPRQVLRHPHPDSCPGIPL